MIKTEIEFMYDTFECILRALQYIINDDYHNESLQMSLNKYIKSTIKEINEIQQQYEENKQ